MVAIPSRDKLLLGLAYRHGLRASEAVGLRWEAFDLARYRRSGWRGLAKLIAAAGKRGRYPKP